MVTSGRGFDIVEAAGIRRMNAVDVPAVLPQRDLRSVRPEAVRAGPARIEWRWGHPRGLPGAPASDCLFNFLRLADTDDVEEYVQFAAVHGVLGLSEDGYPGTSGATAPPEVPEEPGWHFELVELWRPYALNAKMLLILAMALRGQEMIDPFAVLDEAGIRREILDRFRVAPKPRRWYMLHEDDLYRVPGGVMPGEEGLPFIGILPGLTDLYLISSAMDVAGQRRALMVWLQEHWLDLASITPVVEWSTGPAKLVLRLSHQNWGLGDFRGDGTNMYWPEDTLFSVLAAELAGIICSDRYVAHCARCVQLHSSKIKVRTDQPNYCDPCRLAVRRATNRDAARRRYARQRAAKADTVADNQEPNPGTDSGQAKG